MLYIVYFLYFGLLAHAAIPYRGPHGLGHRPHSNRRRPQHTHLISRDEHVRYFDMPIDHFDDANKNTYKNRYWINATYYKPGGPVIFNDVGETNAQPLFPDELQEAMGPTTAMSIAKRFNGLAILWEHRYYGHSWPVPMDLSTGKPKNGNHNYKYFTLEQALEDTVYFANHFEPEGLEDHWDALSPKNTPWIWVGGSYPADRGVFIRERNPETFYATYASSSSPQYIVNCWQYYNSAERSMPRNCSADYIAVTEWVDGVLTNGTDEQILDIKTAVYKAVHFLNWNSTPDEAKVKKITNQQVGMALLSPIRNSYFQWNGYPAFADFCDDVETQGRTRIRTTDNGGYEEPVAFEGGLAAEYNITVAWEAFSKALWNQGVSFWDGSTADLDSNSWTYHMCAELGSYTDVGRPSYPRNIVSKFLTLDDFFEMCAKEFPGAGLPARPKTENVLKYGGYKANPSNTLFTNGEFDPWRAFTLANMEPNAPHRLGLQIIPKCNVPPRPKTYFGIMYHDAGHCNDLYADNSNTDFMGEPFWAGLGLFTRALEEWLPCFNNGSYADMTFGFPGHS